MVSNIGAKINLKMTKCSGILNQQSMLSTGLLGKMGFDNLLANSNGVQSRFFIQKNAISMPEQALP